MAKNVIILGAGASVDAGAPLMFDFLDAAERVWQQGFAAPFDEDFKQVFNGIYKLEQVLAKASVDVNNLESVFGAFEMARLCGKLADLESEDIDKLATSLQRVIARTLELSMKHQGDRHTLLPPVGYNELGELLKNKMADVSFITFNYDLGLDHAILAATGRDPDYGFGTPKSSKYKVLKLHGSIHWYRNGDMDGDLTSIPLRDAFSQSYVDTHMGDPNKLAINVSKKLTNLGNKPPFIVPPTWKKGDHYSAIAPIWKIAAQELGEAEQILVCGFSLPETDQYFRYLYALGTAGPVRLKKIAVFDPSDQVGNRFRQLLGSAALARYSYKTDTFRGFINWLRSDARFF